MFNNKKKLGLILQLTREIFFCKNSSGKLHDWEWKSDQISHVIVIPLI